MTLPPATRHAAILASATDYANIVTDLDARVTDWNSGAENTLGWSEADMLGEPVDRIFTPEDREDGRSRLEMSIALSEGSAEDEHWHLRAEGSRF